MGSRIKLRFVVAVGTVALAALAVPEAVLLAQADTAPVVQALAQDDSNGYEIEVLEIVAAIKGGELELALTRVEKHVSRFPKSRIGHLLKADILQAMSSELASVGQPPSALSKDQMNSDAVEGLLKQIRIRWQHANEVHPEVEQLVPASLIDMGRHRYVIVTDMSEGRLYLYRNENSQPQLVRDYYLTVGSAGYGKEVEGDNKTPVGVYSIYQHISDRELPDLYGGGAYPVDYPNRYDRARKRTGYGIWLHGTPSDTYARSPWASEGCFVLSNADLKDIEAYIDVEARTPVVLSDAIEWVTPVELQSRREQLLATLLQWRQDWESLDTEAYLSHYSKEQFNFGLESFSPWATRKKQVNRAKTFVQVDVDIKDLFVYPGEQEMFVVRYTQRYLSNNYSGETDKEQYWKRDADGRWRIIYES